MNRLPRSALASRNAGVPICRAPLRLVVIAALIHATLFTTHRVEAADITIKLAVMFPGNWGSPNFFPTLLWGPGSTQWTYNNIWAPMEYFLDGINNGKWTTLMLGNQTVELNIDMFDVDIIQWDYLPPEWLTALTNDTYLAMIYFGIPPRFFEPFRDPEKQGFLRITGWSSPDYADQPPGALQLEKNLAVPSRFQVFTKMFINRGITRVAMVTHDPLDNLGPSAYTAPLIEQLQEDGLQVVYDYRNITQTSITYFGNQTRADVQPALDQGFITNEVMFADPLNIQTLKDYSAGTGNRLAEDLISAIMQSNAEVLFVSIEGTDLANDNEDYKTFVRLVAEREVNVKAWIWMEASLETDWFSDGPGFDTNFLLDIREFDPRIQLFDDLLQVYTRDVIEDFRISFWNPEGRTLSQRDDQAIRPLHFIATIVSKLSFWSDDMQTNRDNVRVGFYQRVFNTFSGSEMRILSDNTVSTPSLAAQIQGSEWRIVSPATLAQTLVVLPMPTFQSRRGCPPGSFNTGLECRNCSANTFNNQTNSTSCQLCPAGFGQLLEGETSCEMCLPGYANSGNSILGCVICPAGTNASEPASTSCSRCPRAYYQNETGATTCKNCSTSRTTDNLGSTSVKQCVCKEGYYFSGIFENGFDGRELDSMDLPQTDIPPGSCRRCNPRLYKCRGRFEQPMAMEGFYIEGYTIRDRNDFPVTYECNPREACPGGEPRSCKKHRTGLVCGRCKKGYSKSRNGDCTKCTFRGSPVVLLTILLIVMLPVAGLFYSKTSYEDPKRRASQALDQSSQSATTAKSDKGADDPDKAFLIVLSFAQHIGIISSFNLKLEIQVLTLLSIPRLFMLDASIVGLSCWGLESFGSQLMLVSSIPFLFVVAITIVHFGFEALLRYGDKCDCMNPSLIRGGRRTAWLLWFRRQFIDGTHGLGLIRILATAAQVSSFLYVALTSIATTHVDCFRHPSGDSTVRTHPYVICDFTSKRGQEWRDQIWLSAGAIFLYIVSPYVASIVISFKMSNIIEKTKSKGGEIDEFDQIFKSAFRYVVGKYRHGMVWWECIWMARNMSLALSTVIVPNIGQLQLLYYGVILTFYAFASMTFSPWRRTANSKLDIALTVLLMHIVTLIGLFYTFDLPDDINSRVARHAAGILLFIDLLLIVPFVWMMGSRGAHQSAKGLPGFFINSKWLSLMTSPHTKSSVQHTIIDASSGGHSARIGGSVVSARTDHTEVHQHIQVESGMRPSGVSIMTPDEIVPYHERERRKHSSKGGNRKGSRGRASRVSINTDVDDLHGSPPPVDEQKGEGEGSDNSLSPRPPPQPRMSDMGPSPHDISDGGQRRSSAFSSCLLDEDEGDSASNADHGGPHAGDTYRQGRRDSDWEGDISERAHVLAMNDRTVSLGLLGFETQLHSSSKYTHGSDRLSVGSGGPAFETKLMTETVELNPPRTVETHMHPWQGR
ncbi:unnamed protein product [Vitrella brassicaformis CCMP3155]|uniref:Tyrosine-protein kinase ephrin type A/B receptor-like domain-containing protein n=1 Tax=Vitrella brassicaformis (strain CCMP3155) TaxID=1169540 RepID=A0A0G4GCC1_VITBC|nr:unnamed protein product [Vitrella brassicaformis CCMP3155]|eukprot:CEM26948.1 unnamed protein product [Vitrella brassicaformis CCMP3155]